MKAKQIVRTPIPPLKLGDYLLCFHTNPPALLKYPLLAVQCLKFLEADSAEMRTSQLYQQSPAQRTVLNTNTKTQIQMYTIHTYIQIRVYTIIQKQMYELHTNTEIHMHTICKTHGNTNAIHTIYSNI